MKVKIKKLHADAVIPSYSKSGDAGMDLTATAWGDLQLHGELDPSGYEPPIIYREYQTGLSIEIPEGFAGFIFPRSSISNSALIMANSVGVIDSGYRGEIKVRFKILNNDDFKYAVGERIAQLIILSIPTVELVEVEELTNSERGIGGYGSTGK